MNPIEYVRRLGDETARVMQTRRYHWLVAIYLIVLGASSLHVFEPEYWQGRRLQRHIQEISPQWEAFKRANPSFQRVTLTARPDSAWGVVFAATGEIPWTADARLLAEFMWSTHPPSSVDSSRLTTDSSGLPHVPAAVR